MSEACLQSQFTMFWNRAIEIENVSNWYSAVGIKIKHGSPLTEIHMEDVTRSVLWMTQRCGPRGEYRESLLEHFLPDANTSYCFINIYSLDFIGVVFKWRNGPRLGSIRTVGHNCAI